MPFYGPAAANPERGEPTPMSPHEYRKFHEEAEASYGIDKKLEDAAVNGATLMIKNSITGVVEEHEQPKVRQAVLM